MAVQIYSGVITAMITPFKDDRLDISSFEGLIARQIEARTDAILVAGSTGEGNCLRSDEVAILLKQAVDQCTGTKTKVIVGIATASTADALERLELVSKNGVDGVMLTVPYYIKPSQDGIIRYFQELHDATNLPIIIYDNPGRTGSKLTDETILTLAQMPRIQALKDADSDIRRPLRIGRNCIGFNMLTGNDDNLLAYTSMGGVGAVSVISNIIPKSFKKLVELTIGNDGVLERKGVDRVAAIGLQRQVLPIYEAIYSVGNPVGIKCAHFHLGNCRNELRKPLLPAKGDVSNMINIIVPLIEKMEAIN